MPAAIRRKYILNSPVLSAYGDFRYREIDLKAARVFVLDGEIESAVGHASTAEALGRLLGLPIEHRRIEIVMAPGDVALVFRLGRRLPEGHLLKVDELLALGPTFGLLERLS